MLDAGWDSDAVPLQDDTPNDVQLRQTLLDTWFMAPRVKTFESMDKGTLNEANIVKWLPSFLEQNSDYSALAIKEYGLMANKEKPWMATSVDSMIVLEGIETSSIVVCGEWKTRVTPTTRDKIKAIALEHGKMNCVHVKSSAEDSGVPLFHTLVPQRDYRQQLLHHVAVTRSNGALYVEATEIGIEYVVLVQFDDDVLDAYESSAVTEMAKWMTPFHGLELNSTLEGDVISFCDSLELKWATDIDTFTQVVALWVTAREIVTSSGVPFPHTRRLIPAMIDMWNQTKGGVDVFSKLLSNIKPVHKKLNYHGLIHTRSILSLLTNAHLLSRAAQVWHESATPITERFQSYSQFKNRLNSVRTLPMFLRQVMHVIKQVEPLPVHEVNIPQADIPHVKKKRRTSFGAGGVVMPENHKDHIPAFSKSNKRKRCIVCCHHCSTGNGHKWASGFLTTKGCYSCSALLARHELRKRGRSTGRVRAGDMTENEDIVPLYSQPRYKEHGDHRSCFEIHHETRGAYPPYVGCHAGQGHADAAAATADTPADSTTE